MFASLAKNALYLTQILSKNLEKIVWDVEAMPTTTWRSKSLQRLSPSLGRRFDPDYFLFYHVRFNHRLRI